MRQHLLVALLCMLIFTADCHAISSAVPGPEHVIGSQSASELMFLLATSAELVLSVWEVTSQKERQETWKKVSLVFPSYQLWRGHFSPDDISGPAQVCIDWMPVLRQPYTENEIEACWTLMNESVGDKQIVGESGARDMTKDNIIALMKFLLRILVIIFAASVPMEFLSGHAVWVPGTKQASTSQDRCPPIAASKTEQFGTYEFIDPSLTICSGNHYGSICHIVCQPGYVPSPHFGNVAVCALDLSTNTLRWLPDNKAYQDICRPDVVQGAPNLIVHLSKFDNSRGALVDPARIGLDAIPEPCWDDINCRLTRTQSAQYIPVPTRPADSLRDWLSFSKSANSGQSLRINLFPFNGFQELTLFVVLQPTTRADILNSQGFVRLGAISSAIVDHVKWDEMMTTLKATSLCDNQKIILTICIKGDTAKTGRIHLRVNGEPFDEGEGFRVALTDTTTWDNVVPLFKSGATRLPIPVGHAGPLTNFDRTKGYSGLLGELILYNNFLDPLSVDQANLRRIETIEWHLATKWGFADALVPAKPQKPVISTQSKGGIKLYLPEQGTGYSLGKFSQTLRSNMGDALEINPDTSIDTTLAQGHQFWVEASNPSLPTCAWFGQSQVLVSEKVRLTN
eukprot:c4983_g1_i1.p1 GENE.c4983_g1_i1~~c4983_g1_i1.p1  ORF type:complete len:625 (+),score=154.08 c4983_g1_i1:38-1912(+)